MTADLTVYNGGVHRLVVGDPEAGALEWLSGCQPDLAVVDLPGSHNDQRLRAILAACALAPAAVVETEMRQYDRIWELGAEAGMTLQRTWVAEHSPGRDCQLLCFGEVAWPDWETGTDRQAIRLAILSLTPPGGIVLDPWTVHTHVPKIVVETGRRFAGLEIDHGRAQKILEVLDA